MHSPAYLGNTSRHPALVERQPPSRSQVKIKRPQPACCCAPHGAPRLDRHGLSQTGISSCCTTRGFRQSSLQGAQGKPRSPQRPQASGQMSVPIYLYWLPILVTHWDPQLSLSRHLVQYESQSLHRGPIVPTLRVPEQATTSNTCAAAICQEESQDALPACQASIHHFEHITGHLQLWVAWAQRRGLSGWRQRLV